MNNLASSLHSGFVLRPDLLRTAIASLAALFVDLMPLAFALLMVRPANAATDEEKTGPTGGRGWRTGGRKRLKVLGRNVKAEG